MTLGEFVPGYRPAGLGEGPMRATPPLDLDDGIRVLVTVHPSYLLRLPDADAKSREYHRFVQDLKIAADVLRKSARAA